MNLEYIKISRSKRLSQWLRQRLSSAFVLDTRLWRYVIASLWAFSCLAVAISAQGMPTGFGVMFDTVTAVSLNTIALALASAAVAALLAIVGLNVPRFTAGSLLYGGGLAYFIFYYSEFGIIGSAIFCVLFALLAAMIGMLIGLLAGNWEKKWIRAGTAALMVGVVLSSIYTASGASLTFPAMSHSDADSAYSSDKGEVRSQSTIVTDPAEPGSSIYDYFTYGSGLDQHRNEYGNRVELESHSVDASMYINDWSWLRSKFWGFDPKELPLNGRVWMPEGEGPFPLVLMVHGNHLMEKFSDEGYGYLGELLASRGIAAISIDENFLNYSVWSGIPDEDMKVRAWLLLKHIQQLQNFTRQVGSPFHNKINFQQLSLLGHSRGGQAAAMAADRNRWFKEDKGLPEQSSYIIQAVIALAPTDTWVDNKQSQLKDVFYLTLQGAKDSDLVNFYGDRQYGRASFTNGSRGFKASLYIEDANHSQFNTEWGETDQSYPAGLFVRPKAKLQAEEQRRIAKVYVGAFLETVFHGSQQYLALFRDYRTGLGMLPSTGYFNQYEGGDVRQLANFDGDDRAVPSPGSTAAATNMMNWKHEEALDRQRKEKGDKGVILEWESDASYTVHLQPTSVEASEKDSILLSMANIMRQVPELDIEVADRSGAVVRLPLSQFMEIQQLPAVDFTWLPAMEAVLSKGKFKDSAEAVFQTYELPMREFIKGNSRFNPAEWSRITCYFGGGPGKVMLDDLGLVIGQPLASF